MTSTDLRFEWITVAPGPFLMGSDPGPAGADFADEGPRHRPRLSAFQVARVPVTNAQYRLFVEATGHPAPGHWAGGPVPIGKEQHPVTYVDWDDAQAFCRWTGVRLLTEAEWEKAARGGDGRQWPWGNAQPVEERCNFNGSIGDTCPVERHPAGASPFGVLDMAGNVWEWTSSLYRSYPYRAEDGREDPGPRGPRVLRGGTYLHDRRQIRCAYRHGMYPAARDVYIGFRVAAAAPAATPRDTQRWSARPRATSRPVDFDWVNVPTSELLMGSDPSERRRVAFDNERPRHLVRVPAFRLARVPVTNAQYRPFVEATGHAAPGHWVDGRVAVGTEAHPVTYVDWHDAQAFCRWAGVRLPTEAEWELAARGSDGRIWPWGDEPPDPTMANYGRSTKEAGTTPTDQHRSAASPFGVLDLAGNVWEWTASLYRGYPYRSDDGREDSESRGQRVLRGGSFSSASDRYLGCAARSMSYPERRRDHIGFRVAAVEP